MQVLGNKNCNNDQSILIKICTRNSEEWVFTPIDLWRFYSRTKEVQTKLFVTDAVS